MCVCMCISVIVPLQLSRPFSKGTNFDASFKLSRFAVIARSITFPFNYPRLKEFEKIVFRPLFRYTIVQLNIYEKKRFVFLYLSKILCSILSSKVFHFNIHFLKKNLRNEKYKISVSVLNNSSKIHYYKTKTVEMSRSNVTRDTYYSVKILYSEKTTGHTERITYVNRERDARIGH